MQGTPFGRAEVYMKFLMPSVIKLGCERCKNKEFKIFLLPVKISCLCCFCCAVSVSEFFFCVLDKEFGMFGMC